MIKKLNLMELQAPANDADEPDLNFDDDEAEPVVRQKRVKKSLFRKYLDKSEKRYNKGLKAYEGGAKKRASARVGAKKATATYNKRMGDLAARGRSGTWQSTKGVIRAATSYIPFTEEAQQLDEQALIEAGVDNYDLNNFDYFLVEKKSSRKKTNISVDKTFNAVGNAIGDTTLAIVKVAKDAAHEHAKEISKSWKVAKGKVGKAATKEGKRWKKDFKGAGKAIEKEAGAWVKDGKKAWKGAKTLTSKKRFNAAANRRQKSGYDDETKAKIKDMKAKKKELKEDMDYNVQDVQPNLAVAVQAAIAGEPAAFQGILADALRAKAADALDNYREYVAQSAFSDNEEDDIEDDEVDLEGAEVVAEWADNGDGYDQNDPEDEDEDDEDNGEEVEEFEFDDEDEEDEDE